MPLTNPADAIHARFETVCERMPRIAAAIEAFADPTLRERAYYELIGILNPSPGDEDEPVDVIAVPQCDQPFTGSVDLHRLSEWINDEAPTAWRESVQHFEPITAAVIRFLEQGAAAWTQTLLVKHALMTAAGFTAEQVDGDLAALVREMAADPPPIAPEVEQLATYLRGQAEPDESVAEVAIRLIERLRQGRPALVSTPEVQMVADGVHADTGQVDDRDSPPEPQPNSITAAVDAYRKRTGTS